MKLVKKNYVIWTVGHKNMRANIIEIVFYILWNWNFLKIFIFAICHLIFHTPKTDGWHLTWVIPYRENTILINFALEIPKTLLEICEDDKMLYNLFYVRMILYGLIKWKFLNILVIYKFYILFNFGANLAKYQ